MSTLRRISTYLLVRLLTIAATIFIGVYITVTVSNRGGFLDMSVYNDAKNVAIQEAYKQSGSDFFSYGDFVAKRSAYWAEAFGLNQPRYLRNLRWTWNALTFHWGDTLTQKDPTRSSLRAQDVTSPLRNSVQRILSEHFPNTLLLIGAADLFIFLLGIPLALNLSLRYGSWFDKVMVALSPVSSIPSWVYGVLLVIIFAIQLHWLPAMRMYDSLPPQTSWERVLMVARHMVLPVVAIILSLFFQCVYTWRTYFLTHASEDYVDFARAKGLPPHVIQRDYILRPTLPYILSTFAQMLLGFWQMLTALEYFFQWPGIGLLYVQALGVEIPETHVIDAAIFIGIVVIFAYLMGATILILDILYVILDPRIKLDEGESQVFGVSGRQNAWQRFKAWCEGLRQGRRSRQVSEMPQAWPERLGMRFRSLGRKSAPAESVLGNFSRRDAAPGRPPAPQAAQRPRLFPFFKNMLRYPSAFVGVTLVSLLSVAALAVLVFASPTEVKAAWYGSLTSGRIERPRNARPAWFNWFRADPLPETIAFKQPTQKTVAGKTQTLTYTFDYRSRTCPQELMIYFHPTFAKKEPFVALTWTTPDGRNFSLGNRSLNTSSSYQLTIDLPPRYFRPGLRTSQAQASGSGGKPLTCAIFFDPAQKEIMALPGTYTLTMEVVTFEPEADVSAEVLVLGEAYGLAGTDYRRRDLLLPLLNGLPIALGLGLGGALITTLISMILAAAGVWYGRWVDVVIQRVIEANMVLPVLAIGVMLYYCYFLNLWLILGLVILLNAFGSTAKSYRAAFLQAKAAPYMEAARTYGASNTRLIMQYLVPRVLPVIAPQLVTLVPAYVFLEATLGIFGVSDPTVPTWGGMLYDALRHGVIQGLYYWIAEPVCLLLLTGLSFALLGFALDRVLNPRVNGME